MTTFSLEVIPSSIRAEGFYQPLFHETRLDTASELDKELLLFTGRWLYAVICCFLCILTW